MLACLDGYTRLYTMGSDVECCYPASCTPSHLRRARHHASPTAGASGVQVVKQCVETEGVEPTYVRTEILPEFFRAFWVRRMALDRRNYRQLVETTVALAQKVLTSILTLPSPYGRCARPVIAHRGSQEWA